MKVKKHKYFSLLFFASICGMVFSQEKTPDELLKQKIESVSENLNAEDADFSSLMDQLNYFRAHPLNLNTATREQLKDLVILNEIQINNLLEHIRKNGNLINVYEIQSIDGFDVQTIDLLINYVAIENTETTTLKLRSIRVGKEY